MGDAARLMREWKEKEQHDFTPRTKMAMKLYATGAVRTQKEAAEIAGIHPTYLSIVKNTPTGERYFEQTDSQIQERAVSLSAVIAKLSEKALKVMEEQIKNGSTEEVKFKAAKDILDRNPETSKMNKVQVEAFTLSGRDAKEIAAALAEGRALTALDEQVAEGDFVKVEEVPVRPELMGGTE